jgi:hypothetical protein
LASSAMLAPAARDAPPFVDDAQDHGASPPRSPLVEPPGALSSDVTQANIGATICVHGWTATVRPPTSYTQHLKQLMLTRAGLKPADSLNYELDHFVPLALRGHPRSEDNLWLQPWIGEWSARTKDRLVRWKAGGYEGRLTRETTPSRRRATGRS